MTGRGQPSASRQSERKVIRREDARFCKARVVYKTCISRRVGSEAAAQVLIVVDRVASLPITVPLLLELTLQLLILQLLVGRIAIDLTVDGAVALALLDLTVEITLPLLVLSLRRLGDRVRARADGGDGNHR